MGFSRSSVMESLSGTWTHVSNTWQRGIRAEEHSWMNCLLMCAHSTDRTSSRTTSPSSRLASLRMSEPERPSRQINCAIRTISRQKIFRLYLVILSHVPEVERIACHSDHRA